MLLLGRKVGEEVVLTMGDVEVVVTVVQLKANGAVRLGFDAPESVRILRREIIARDSERERAEGLLQPA